MGCSSRRAFHEGDLETALLLATGLLELFKSLLPQNADQLLLARDLSTQEAEAGVLWVPGQPGTHSEIPS